ncbi:uncharacterized protein K02A2.6-like [Vanessa cardui]|uniref:uncharacterized protein K02A2.6-like n=1 Tax=Vanessa cardui TaxID=171605 RepID=UPI001F12FD72|nr:uncharacterized protein K02A2.6-like [Vanessa cardui]
MSGAGRSGGAGGAAASDGGGDRVADGRVPCARCGRATHTPSKCRYKNFTCDLCGIKGHLKVMCLNKSNNAGPIGRAKSKGQYFINNSSDSEGDDGNFYNLVTGGEGDKPYYATLFVNNVKCKFEIDTGSRISAISKTFYDKYFNDIVIYSKNLILKSYTGDTIDTLGYIDVDVRFGQNSAKLKLYVVENGGPPLMGRTWIKELKLSIVECHKITEPDSIASRLKREYPEVFAEGLGTFKSCIRLHLNDKKPVFVKARPLPLSLRERVEAELERLQREGVIYKVDRSDYGTPIVPVIKSNGDIRICGDYKITLNPILKDFHYPLPRIEEIFSILSGGEQYTKLDLSSAFQQCLLHEESQAMTAITTHVGTFVYRRVPFGIKCIPENFQKIMEETLNGLPSTAVFADDICITGKDSDTHLKNLRAVLQRLKDNGLRINFDKCQFFKDSVTYLGYKINKNGLHTDTKKIKAIVDAPLPTNITELRSFIGLVNFYAKFVCNISEILKPLYDLLKKDVKWVWTHKCDKAFIKIKELLSSAPVLAHYDPELPLILAVDSSAYGLGAVLMQRGADGRERPISCASRTLNAAERNYSQLDKEALAIVFGVTKHHQYLYGRRFILRSDHKPLSYIFGKNKGIPTTAASRLQRYAMKLAAYDFTVEFVRSAENCQADALSRLPLPRSSVGRGTKESEAATYLNFVQDSFPLSFKDIKSETAKDPILSKIYGYVLYGWPTAVDKEYIAYFRRKENIYIDQGCLLWGYKIIIPGTLQNAILKEIHDGHPGIVKMKQIARYYVWWATIDADIERAVRDCGACLAVRPAPPPAPLHSWPWPVEPWSRLHLDYLGPFNNKYYLVIIDAHSKWIEAEKVSSTSAANLISVLRKIFARFGFPKRIISDNGPPFTSAEVATYFQRNGIGHTFTAPYHPASNGAAENAVRSVKRALKKASLENEDENTALSRFLFSYRNTEHSTTGREPSVALLGRRLRGRLDLLRPDTDERVRDRQLASELRQDAPLRVVAPGDSVLIRDYSRRNRKWAEGVVIDRSSPVSYSVKTSDGQIHKRHMDQIMCDKNRKSRFSLTKIEAYDRPGVEAEEGSEARELKEKDELVNRSSPEKSSRLSTDHMSPVAAVGHVRRQAAVQCLQKIKKKSEIKYLKDQRPPQIIML